MNAIGWKTSCCRRVTAVTMAVVAVGLLYSGPGLADDTGVSVLEQFWNYPVLRPHTQAHYLSSYDRTGGNDDGFEGTYSALYVDENGEHVIFDQAGPGVVYTLWFTSRVSGWSPLAWGDMRFYFDGESSPRVDLDANELFAGRTASFPAPFVFSPFESTGGHVSYVPIPFREHLKITTERRAGFYNIFWHSLRRRPGDRELDVRPGSRSAGGHVDQSRAAPGAAARGGRAVSGDSRHPRNADLADWSGGAGAGSGTALGGRGDDCRTPLQPAGSALAVSTAPSHAAHLVGRRSRRSTCRSDTSSGRAWVKRRSAVCRSA